MGRLVASGEGIAAILMHFFFAAIGAAGSINAGEAWNTRQDGHWACRPGF